MKNNTKLATNVALQEKIKQVIIDRGLKSGDLMPTENELIDLLEVSRSSLREAIKSLEALHILDIKHGVGTFVGEASLIPMVRGLTFYAQLNLKRDSKTVLDILDIREILEYGFAPMVLTQITQKDIALLHSLLANMENNAKQKQFSLEDEHQIHLTLYAPLKNQLLTQYLDAFWQIYQSLEENLPPNLITPEQLAIQHRELIDAVELRDLARMQQAILVYFRKIRQRLTQGEVNE
ncbi:FadR/GntR family transcriptional regulator [Pasteurellaceae bacterium LIM206]|nr:FadR/GntR family transcriptional regulator [Pasteurellaceae bacterium LIM206]